MWWVELKGIGILRENRSLGRATLDKAAIACARVRGSSLVRGVGAFAGPAREGFAVTRENHRRRVVAVVHRLGSGPRATIGAWRCSGLAHVGLRSSSAE